MLPRNIENELNQDMKINVSVKHDFFLILKRRKKVKYFNRNKTSNSVHIPLKILSDPSNTKMGQEATLQTIWYCRQ